MNEIVIPTTLNEEIAGRASPDRPFIAAPISDVFSVYLDLVRVLAALCVFVSHSVHLYEGWIPLSTFAHEAVVVFFVLSGIVISSTTARAKATCQSYFLARASRIYSVAAPALILSFSLMLINSTLNGQQFDIDWATYGIRTISALTFSSESWYYQTFPWNAPYWSLCYEVWYYVIFGIVFFKVRHATTLAVFAACLAGPAVMILFPIWWLGVEFMRRPSLSFGDRRYGWIAFIASIFCIMEIDNYNIDGLIRNYLHSNIPAFWRLYISQRFVTDYILGLLMVANAIAFRSIQDDVRKFALFVSKPVKYLSGYTFSIYLYHYPLVRLCEAQFPNTDNSLIHYVFCMSAILLIIIVIGTYTEKKKHVAEKIIVIVWHTLKPFVGTANRLGRIAIGSLLKP